MKLNLNTGVMFALLTALRAPQYFAQLNTVTAAFQRAIATRREVLLAATLALVLAGSAGVRAESISQSVYCTPGMPVSLAQFNPASGWLTSVDISFSGMAGGQVMVNNPTPVDTAFTVYLSAPAHARVVGSSLAGYGYGASTSGGFVSAYSSTWTSVFGGVSGFGVTSLPEDLSFFTGNGFVTINADGDIPMFFGDPPSLMYTPYNFDSIVTDITLTYNYTIVPEPSTLTLLVGGLTLLGLYSKR
jgi:hypothetical protein